MSHRLTIELVPSTCWYTNVRSNVSAKQWDVIRKKSYNIAGNKCQICQDTGKNQGHNHNVECHEIWEYDEANKIQKLIGLISLCPNCHKVKHVGLSQLQGHGELVIEQLMKVNSITRSEAKKMIEEAFEIWRRRSQYDWTLDITYVQEFLK